MFSLTRMISRWRAAAVLAGLVTLTATDVASAHGGSRQTRYAHGAVVSRQHHVPVHHDRATRQFHRGYDAGSRAGSRAGYEAARHHGYYYAAPKIHHKRWSRSYRNGYAIGYAEAYARSYHLATRNRHHRRHVSRWS